MKAIVEERVFELPLWGLIYNSYSMSYMPWEDPFNVSFFFVLFNASLTFSVSLLIVSVCLCLYLFANLWVSDHCHLLMQDIISISWMPRWKTKRCNGAWSKSACIQPQLITILPQFQPQSDWTQGPEGMTACWHFGMWDDDLVEEFLAENQGSYHPELGLKPERVGGWNSGAAISTMRKKADCFSLRLGQGLLNSSREKRSMLLGPRQHRAT